MAPKSRGKLTVPTTKPLSDSLRLPLNSPHVWRTFSKLSRSSLLALASQWCEKDNLKSCGPYILGEEDEEDLEAAYAAAESLAEVEGLYKEELPARRGSKREVVDRILEGDWRHGISLKQLAMAETQYIMEHQSANRWTALRLAQRAKDDDDEEGAQRQHLPRLHAATFVRALQKEISPVAKAHFYIHLPESLPVTVLRIYLHDTPYNTTSALRTVSSNGKAKKPNPSEAPKSIFVMLPSGTPYVYVSLASSGTNLTDPESKSIQKFVVEAIPKALSRPGRRYDLEATAMTARSLTALLAHRGAERSNSAAGGWSIFVTDSKGRNALDFGDEKEDKANDDGDDAENDKENISDVPGGKKRPFEHPDATNNTDLNTRKRLKLLASSRFGNYGLPDDNKNLHSFSAKVTDSFDRRAQAGKQGGDGLFVQGDTEAGGSFKPDVRLTFQGSHVFAGLRMLVEKGVIDGERMPGWMTGEAAVSVGVVKDGRIDAPSTA